MGEKDPDAIQLIHSTKATKKMPKVWFRVFLGFTIAKFSGVSNLIYFLYRNKQLYRLQFATYLIVTLIRWLIIKKVTL